MAIEVPTLMKSVSERSRLDPAAPLLLRRPLPPHTPLPAISSDPAISSVNQEWATFNAVPGQSGTVSVPVEQAQLADRHLIGCLIRAVNVLATRNDELIREIERLHHFFEEVMDLASEDLVQIHAVLASAVTDAGEPGSPGQ